MKKKNKVWPEEKEQFIYDDPGLIKPAFIVSFSPFKIKKLWAARDGRCYPTQDMARYASATHKRCECGNLHEKHWMCCSVCRERNAWEKYKSLQPIEWDRETPLYSEIHDQYFWDEDGLIDFCHDNGTEPDHMRLYLCAPVVANQIDDEYWGDQLPEEQYLDDVCSKLAELVAQVNEFIIKEKPVLSWRPDFKKRSVV